MALFGSESGYQSGDLLTGRLSDRLEVVAFVEYWWLRERNDPYQEWHRDQERMYAMGVFSRAMSSVSATNAKALLDDASFAEQYPVLFAFLAQDHNDEGKPRQTSTLLLLVEQGTCKGCLRERESNVSLWRSSETIIGVFQELEKGLNEPKVDWRPPSKSRHHR